MQLDSYVIFNGDCEAAFKLYERVLGGKIQMMLTHGDSPMADQVGPEWRDKIMHAALAIGNRILMGHDAPPSHYEKPQGFGLSLEMDDAAEAQRIFNAFSEKGTVTMPLQETFWAKHFGMLVDRFGIPWMINCGSAANKEK